MKTISTGRRGVAILAALAVAAGALSGCAAQPVAPAGDYPDLSLAKTKSPTQLLRNTAIGRVSRVLVNNLDTQTDTSLPCLPEGDDPKGLVRQWQSTADIALEEWKWANAAEISAELVATFVEEGWVEATTDGTVELTKDGSLATLTVRPSTTDGVIAVTVTGPCVVTEGADSDEVAALS